MLQQFSLGGQEATRRARDELFGVQNARKAYTGMLAGLQNPQTIQSKQQREDELLSQVAANSEVAALASAWTDVAEINAEYQGCGFRIFEDVNILGCRIPGIEGYHHNPGLPHRYKQLKALITIVLQTGHPAALTETPLNESPGQTIGSLIDFRIGKYPILKNDAGAIRKTFSRNTHPGAGIEFHSDPLFNF